ncbi:MAG: 4-alpha-glucanotransferase [Gammaproteobacteria bacterium PRO9]|nr:4-alpha-glucanotransferase [Gammaproteobacteria bacterium PRO9]
MAQSLLAGPRRAGVLFHPTSLPGPWASGVLGADGRRFADWLKEAGFSLWQMLPVGPVGAAGSPYQSASAFAGNARLIDPGELVEAGWLGADAVATAIGRGGQWEQRQALLREAWSNFRRGARPADREAFQQFWQEQRGWLVPVALYRAAVARFGGGGWWTWPEDLRHRRRDAVLAFMKEAAADIREVAFEQWVFMRQWRRLRDHAAGCGVQLLGDLPIYVDLDGADVWWHRHLFRVSPDGQALAVAGVPPDYFSETGQLWGNPLYDWAAMAESGFSWWIERVRAQLGRFDYLRIDHFRGLQAYWEIPAGAASAREGRWRDAPGAALLTALDKTFANGPFLAEDLGTITPEVHALRRQFGLPGMLIAQFAFDGSRDNPYLPANQVEDAVIYTGTHDNDTVAGWCQGLDERSRRYVCEVLACSPEAIPAALVRSVRQSPAHVAMFPLQDLLLLGSGARMNTPGTVTGNWQWRLKWEQMPASLAGDWHNWLRESGR